MAHIVTRFTLAAAVLCAAGCKDDRGSTVMADDIDSTCESYCQKARTCDDEVMASECVASCKDRVGDCMADEQAQVLDDLDTCAANACDDFAGCTIGAGFQCAFGL